MVCVAGLLAAVVGSWVWFGAPMHDLALAMGMHDRWCSAVDDNGASYHFLRAETAPSILFGPLIALIAWRGWFVARRTVRR
jgi:hypothetical protein